MNTRNYPVGGTCPARWCLWIALLMVICGTDVIAQSRPNILWLTVEDMSPHLGAYGDPLARTPTLDRLAGQGVRYTQAFSVYGVCAPSRSSIITGMYPMTIGTMHMRTTEDSPNVPGPYLVVPPPEVKAFSEYLRAAGYYTTNNSKTDYQFGQPLTAWDESSKQAHWRNRKPGQPFFAVFNHEGTHESQVWPKPEQKLVTDPAKIVVPPYYPDTPVIREDLARLYDNIARMDTWVAERLKELEDAGLADSTIVVFFSDHGDGLPRAKRWPYDSGLHVPVIIRWPGKIGPGTVDDRLISLMDMGPTMLSVAGVQVPKHMQGQAFLGSRAHPARQYIFGGRDRMDETYDHIRAVRDRQYKYLRNYQPEKPYAQPIEYMERGETMKELRRLQAEGKLAGPQLLWMAPTKPPEELYDVTRDPYEIHNLATDPAYRDVLARMRKVMDRWQADIHDLGAVPEADLVQRFWPGKIQPETVAPVLTRKGERVTMKCATPGASIAWTTEEGKNPHWLLYTSPVKVAPGATVRARAIRYGFKESAEARVTSR